jgi:WhiB family transcriptional regulator, redox-sensing transcriptional regulator
MTWRNRAACLDERPEFFFPIGNGHTALPHIEKAKAACRRCEVAEACLTWAIESDPDTGIWGGLSEHERHAFKRCNARARRVS